MGTRVDDSAHPEAAGGSPSANGASDRLMEVVYQELRELAARRLRGERPGHTLQPTALVHEAFLRLAERPDVRWSGRTHFFRAAALQMRRVLVDHARARNRAKRAGGLLRVTLTDDLAATPPEVDILALDEALARLDRRSAQDRTIVELKFFAGMTEEEIAAALGISDRTVRRRWTFARAWLLRELETGSDG